jgi:hypothetical protein
LKINLPAHRVKVNSNFVPFQSLKTPSPRIVRRQLVNPRCNLYRERNLSASSKHVNVSDQSFSRSDSPWVEQISGEVLQFSSACEATEVTLSDRVGRLTEVSRSRDALSGRQEDISNVRAVAMGCLSRASSLTSI